VVLLFYFLDRFLERWVAVAASALFLVHPVQTESVLYVYQRSTLLACFFSLLALICLSRGRSWWALFLFVLAFESKASAIAVPILIALFGGVPSAAGDNRPIGRNLRIGLLITGVALALSAAVVLVYQNESTVGVGAAGNIAPLRYLLTQTRVVFTYLR